MAITSCDVQSGKTSPTAVLCPNLNAQHNESTSFAKDATVSDSRPPAVSKRKKHGPSARLFRNGDIHVLSRVTERERRLVPGLPSKISSLPQAVTLYKANSDDFEVPRRPSKKCKKSVLTLPNEPRHLPQACTVSDMNDSDYSNCKGGRKKRSRLPNQNDKMRKKKDFQFYDRDAQYCAQLNINLDCSSTEVVEPYGGDRRRTKRRQRNKQNKEEFQGQDVWAVLRNLNRFQFEPSPPDSIESIKKHIPKRYRNNTRVVERCTTKEFAYLANIEVDDKTQRPSTSSSRITVIGKNDDLNKICEQIKKSLVNSERISKSKKKPRTPSKNISMKAKRNNLVVNDGTYAIVPREGGDTNRVSRVNKTSGNERNRFTGNHWDSKIKNSEEQTLTTLDGHDGSFASSLYNFEDDLDVRPGFKNSNRSGILSPRSCKSKKNKCLVVSTDSNKNKNASESNANYPERKQRLVTTMTSMRSLTSRKLSPTDIRRRLAQFNFPLIILGKDELSSKFERVIYDPPPHLEGLDQHIWPFMQEWSDRKKYITKSKIQMQPVKKHSSPHILPTITNNKIRNRFTKQITPPDSLASQIKMEQKRSQLSMEHFPPKLQLRKPKPIRQLKDKMLKLIYKKSSRYLVAESINTVIQNQHNDNIKTNRQQFVDASTETQNIRQLRDPAAIAAKVVDLASRSIPTPRSNDTYNAVIRKVRGSVKPSWSKAKWASDFIENVIKKIRSGIYYNLELNCPAITPRNSVHKSATVYLESSVQATPNLSYKDTDTNTDPWLLHNNLYQRSLHEEYHKGIELLPGFEDTLPKMEIKSLDMNQINIKHAVTNVMVQFDVCDEGLKDVDKFTTTVDKSSSCIQLTMSDSETQILKYKKAIMNAIMPAELCTLIPKLIEKIMQQPSVADKEDKCVIVNEPVTDLLPPIMEIPPYTISRPAQPIKDNVRVLPILKKHPIIKPNGFFKQLPAKRSSINLQKHFITFNSFHETEKLANPLSQSQVPLMLYSTVSMTKNVPLKPFNDNIITPCILSEKPKTEFTAENTDNIQKEPIKTDKTLQLYDYSKKRLVCADKKFDPMQFIEDLAKNIYLNIKIVIYIPINSGYDSHRVDELFEDCIDLNDVAPVQNNKELDSIFVGSTSVYQPAIQLQSLKNTKACEANTNKIKKTNTCAVVCNINSKSRKRTFVRLYKKCKSTSNITGEKTFTALNKISNMDDFFQAVGSGKSLLSSVCDGKTGAKILSALGEMKNWISDITSRQALLVLLLTNKKETPNLVRLMPVILQGIAVNRITRASELEMEIEVIEREHFNKINQYEGISYVPASVENQDVLLEELCWIAKTTASDYQKPFDESSEKLLKSLLEKRKKLNPSYLRVMARYVGLGLLKSSKHSAN